MLELLQRCCKINYKNQILKYIKEKSFRIRLFAGNCRKFDTKISFHFEEIVIYKSCQTTSINCFFL
jgi:hypothetical protein